MEEKKMEKMESRTSKSERRVQISRSEESTFNKDDNGGKFSSIRSRFDEEMKKMEDDMNKFRNQLMERERELGHDLDSAFSRPLTSSPSGPTASGRRKTSWIDDLDSPLIKDTIDGKMLKLKFDVTQYAPEEIIVKTIDNKLQVHARHEEKSEHRSVYREYNREFLLPEGVNPEQIKSTLSRDGVLVVEAPLPKVLQQPEQGRTIPIKRM